MPERTGIEMAQPNVAREPSMDEILASIRRIIENNEEQPQVAGRAAETFRVAPESGNDLLSDPETVAAFHAQESEPVEAEPVRPAQPALSLADVAARVRAASERHVTSRMMPEPPAEEPAPAPEIVAEEPVEAPRTGSALVSPAVGERVAQSFGALTEALEAGPRRSFDEIAEEMLRPMLRDWLDDNLPTLVERLVREEIERVARGPRR